MAEAEAPLTSEELRRAALARSAKRGSGVAQRRLVVRWLAWAALRGGRLIALPALLIAVLWWTLQSPGAPGVRGIAEATRQSGQRAASEAWAGPRERRGDTAQAQ